MNSEEGNRSTAEGDLNPYRTPASFHAVERAEDYDQNRVLDGVTTWPLPGRGRRFAAATIDSLAGMLVYFPFVHVTGLLDVTSMFDPDVSSPLSLENSSYMFLVSTLITFGIHGYLWAKRGQSLGKMLLGMRIVDLWGKQASLSRIFWLRVLPLSLVTMAPNLAFLGIIDALLIFGRRKRCLHDWIAGTIVVHAKPPRRVSR